MKTNLLYILLLLTFPTRGQRAPYYFSNQIDSLLQLDVTSYRFQTASVNYSFIGDYRKTLETRDRQFPNARSGTPTAEETDRIKSFRPVDARKAILAEAQKHRILIINEAHHIGLHRVFLLNLLKDLRAQGYTFLGMEALNEGDTALNQRGYPILSTGVYTREPCFGRLIREAKENQVTLFAYEQRNDSVQIHWGRERAQAMNIKRVMDQHPGSKFILYCGYDHAAEDTLKNFMGLPMAGQLKRLTGEDPFTIDQTTLTEYGVVGSRYRKLMNETTDRLFIDSTSTYFNQATYPKRIDCNLYHPNTTDTLGRPTWLKTASTEWVVLLDQVKMDVPYLIKIYLEGEDPDLAVPVDVVEIKSIQEPVACIRYKGRRQFAVVENNKGIRQVIYLK